MSDVSPENLMRGLGGRTQRHRPINGAASRPSDDKRTETAQPLRIVNPVDLDLVTVPEREWIIEGWLPVGCVTANYGDGGAGKTLLAQQLMTACATGTPWAGKSVMRCRSFGLFCEDDENELHRRQGQICDHLSIRLADLGSMRWVSGVGEDNVLATFTSDGKMQVTARFDTLAEAIKANGSRLVTLDSAHDLFAGNENDRTQVRRFIGVLNHLAIEIGGAVLLNCHPSRTGLASGMLDGGSTAWSNSVRSRWSLARPETDSDIEGPDTAERVLTRRKSNYSGTGDTIRLCWINGAFAPVTVDGGIFGTIKRTAIETVFLDLLDRCDLQQLHLSHSRNAANYAPRIMAKRSDAQGYTAREFESAMSRLFTSKQVRVVAYGRRGDPRQKIARDLQGQLPEAAA